MTPKHRSLNPRPTVLNTSKLLETQFIFHTAVIAMKSYWGNRVRYLFWVLGHRIQKQLWNSNCPTILPFVWHDWTTLPNRICGWKLLHLPSCWSLCRDFAPWLRWHTTGQRSTSAQQGWSSKWYKLYSYFAPTPEMGIPRNRLSILWVHRSQYSWFCQMYMWTIWVLGQNKNKYIYIHI